MDYSLRSVLRFALPMILSALVMNLMFSVDRCFLARYSIPAMNASTLGGNFSSVAILIGTGIAQIASVFVGQYNGSGEYHKVCRPVWQMIYFSFALILFYVPLGISCDHFCKIFPEIYQEDCISYMKPLLIFGWLPTLSVALMSFFVGRKKSLFVIFTYIVGIIVNCVLDFLFIFGVPGVIPEMGIKGAAYATVVGEFVCIIFFSSFLFMKEYKRKFGTKDIRFRKDLFGHCIKIGFPSVLERITSQIGWLVITACLSYSSQNLAVCQSFSTVIWMLSTFFIDGCAGSLTALSANLIGKSQKKSISDLLKLFFLLHITSCAVLSVFLIFDQSILFRAFCEINNYGVRLLEDISSMLIILWIVLFLEGVFYLLCAVLHSGGDTKFTMFLDMSTLWGIVIIPVLIMFSLNQLNSIKTVYTLIAISRAINVVLGYYRYKQDKWFNCII